MPAAQNPNKPFSSSLCIVGLVGATLLVYWQVATFDFINLDDAYYVYKNNNVRTGLALDNLLWSLTATDVGLWQPLVWISYQFESAVFGPENPQARHLTNLILHCCNVVLVFYIVWRLSGERVFGFLVALLFALHPQHVQSVAWISQRKDVLSALFFLACLLAYTKTQRVDMARINYFGWYALALILFSMALMCKPSVVPLPILLLLMDFWNAKRDSTLSDVSIVQQLTNKIPFVLVAVVIAGVTLQLKHPGFISKPTSEFENPAFALSGLLFYTKTLVLPWPLPVLIETPATISTPVLLAALILLVVLVIFILRGRRTHPLIGFGLLWFLVMWLPVSGLVPLGQFYVADRYTYLPHIGAFIAVVGFLKLLPVTKIMMKNDFIIIAVVACGVLSAFQVDYWRNAVTLFEREVEINPANKWGYLYAGEALLVRKQTEKAFGYFNRALNIDPEDSMAYEYKGKALRAMSKDDEAYQAYRLAIRNNPRRGHAYVGLAQILMERNDPELARAILEDGLQHFPRDNGLLNQLGYLHGFVLHDEASAIDYYARVLNNNPKDVHALHGIGVLSIRMGNNKGGIERLQKLLTIDPDNETVQTIVSQHGL